MAKLEDDVVYLSDKYYRSHFVLVGDFNKMVFDKICDATGLISIVHAATRGNNQLDTAFSYCNVWTNVRTVTSMVPSDHKAIILSNVNPTSFRVMSKRHVSVAVRT